MAFLEVKNVRIAGISAGVPKDIVKNEGDAVQSVDYDAAAFVETTGVAQRRVSNTLTASDLAFFAADKLLVEDEIKEYDMIVFPGGLPGAENLANDERIKRIVKEFNDENKFIAAICASPAMVLSSAGIEENRYITSYPGEDFEKMLDKANYVEELVVVDENLITSRGPATTLLFAYKLVDVLGGNSEGLKEGMLWNNLEEEKE